MALSLASTAPSADPPSNGGSPSAGVTVDFCHWDEILTLRSFIDRHWRRDHALARDETLLRWQFDPARLATPDPDAGLSVLLAREAGEIRAMVGLICAPFCVNGHVVDGVWLTNLLNLSRDGKGGYGLALFMKVRALGIKAIGAIGINDDVAEIYRGLRFRIVEDLPRWYGTLDGEKASRLMGGEAGAAASPRRDEDSDFAVRPWREAGRASWDETWRRRFAPGFVGMARDAGYLEQRYLRHPAYDYDVHVVSRRKDATIAGIAVTRHERVANDDLCVLRILEFLATEEAAPALAGHLVRLGRREGAAFADFYCSDPCRAEALVEVGFRPVDPTAKAVPPSRLQPLEPGHFRLKCAVWLARDLAKECDLATNCPSLYLTKSDGDQDRPN